MDDLFIHYLARLNEVYPFIRLKMDDSSTTISLGFEQCDDLEEAKSHQEFAALGKYPISIDFQKIEDTIKELTDFSTCTVIAENELLMECKYPLDYKYCILEDDAPEVFSKEFLEYLEAHKRVILNVSKVRHLIAKRIDKTYSDLFDPIPLQERNATEAVPLLNCNSFYCGYPDSSVVCGEQLVTSICEIQHLNKEKFDVFFLKEGRKSVFFEIINKTL